MSVFRVIVASDAREDVAEATMYISEHASPDTAAKWLADLDQLLGSLREMSERLPVAPEDHYFPPGRLRGALHHSHRVLFTVDGDTVRVLRIRHAMRDTAPDF